MKKNLTTVAKIILLSAASSLASNAFSEIAIIVNPSNSSALSKDDVSNIYLGKVKFFPSGEAIAAMDHVEGSDARQKFLTAIVDKNESQMKSYWARLIFTGKGVPPQILSSDADIVKEVSKTPGGIGYVETSAVNDKVKVVLTIN